MTTNNFQHSSNLEKEKINLITKIKEMENTIWNDMIKDIENGHFTIDFDSLLSRYDSTKDIYDRHCLIKKIQSNLGK